MDIDRINKAVTDLLDFKARAEPMLAEWAEHKRRGAGGLPPGQGEPISQELHDAIHARLPEGDLSYKTDEPAPEGGQAATGATQGGDPNDPNAPQPPAGTPTGAAPAAT